LDERSREAKELVTGGCQPGSRLVSDEYLPVELVLEIPDQCADGGLCLFLICRRADEAPRLDDLEEGPGHVDIHIVLPPE
jgi:hypothetical protein